MSHTCLLLQTYKPTRQDMIAGIAEHRAQVDGEAAAPAAAGTVDLDEQLTPTAATRRTAAARTPRAAASGRTTSARSRSTAAAAAHDDGEEVQQPAPRSTGGRPRRTTRGKRVVPIPGTLLLLHMLMNDLYLHHRLCLQWSHHVNMTLQVQVSHPHMQNLQVMGHA